MKVFSNYLEYHYSERVIKKSDPSLYWYERILPSFNWKMYELLGEFKFTFTFMSRSSSSELYFNNLTSGTPDNDHSCTRQSQINSFLRILPFAMQWGVSYHPSIAFVLRCSSNRRSWNLHRYCPKVHVMSPLIFFHFRWPFGQIQIARKSTRGTSRCFINFLFFPTLNFGAKITVSNTQGNWSGIWPRFACIPWSLSRWRIQSRS